MEREYSFKTIILIYASMIVLLIGGVYLCINSYMKTQVVSLSEIEAKTLMEFTNAGKVNLGDEGLEMNLNQYEISQLILSGIQNAHVEGKKTLDVEGLIFNLDKSYITVKDKKGKNYTLAFKGECFVEEENIHFKLKDFKMGKRNSKILGKYYAYKLAIPKDMKLEFPYTNDLAYISKIKSISENQYKIILEVSNENFLTRLNTYMENKEEAKMKINIDDENFPRKIISIFNKEICSKDDVEIVLKTLREDKNTLQDIGLLLNETGITDLHEDLGKLYSKDLSLERIIEKSEHQIESNIKKFHKDFSSMTLAYLYNYPNYKVENENIYVDGVVIDSDKILSYNNYKKDYDVKLLIKDKAIKAEYTIGDREIAKTILNRGE